MESEEKNEGIHLYYLEAEASIEGAGGDLVS